MNAELRIVVIGLAAFGAASTLGTLLVPALARWAERNTSVRAERLTLARVLPMTVGLAVAAIVTAAFVLFEPRLDGERTGALIPALAALAGLALSRSAWQLVALGASTRAAAREWLRTAQPVQLSGISVPASAVTSSFPTVAVIGVWRPRLVIARSILASCTPDELNAILAHEQGHIDRRDNLRRLLFSAAPDVLAWLPASRRLFTAWRDAAEETADNEAGRIGSEGRLHLAAALIKVARLAVNSPVPAGIPASALYRGESLDRRIRTLLDPPVESSNTLPKRWQTLVALIAMTCGAVLALEGVHGVLEIAIHRLP